MRQKAYHTVASLVDAGHLISAGAAIHAAGLGLVVASKPLVDAEAIALAAASTTLSQSKHELRGLRNTVKQKRKEAYDASFIMRDSLKRSFGRSYNAQWEGTGFNRSMKVPRSAASLEELLRTLQAFYTANVQYEVAGVASADVAEAAVSGLSTARAAETVQKGVVRTALAARQQKEKALRRRIAGVVAELTTVLGPIDGRWDAFGLNQPGIKQAPPTPGKVILVLASNNALSVKWDAAARAEYYRIWVKVAGRDEDFIPAGNSADTDFTIENLPPTAEVEVMISAVNNGGESARSEVVKVNTL